MGLSSDPSNQILDVPCQGDRADVVIAGSYLCDVKEREVMPGLAGLVVIREKLDELDAAAKGDKS